jgi:hypothetical protein
MKKLLTLISLFVFVFFITGCEYDGENQTALKEQAETEINQSNLLTIQPPPKISWSLERDNLIKRFKLQNDRSVMFYMYVFIEGVADPLGYYQVNKVSSVNSQLTNTEQIITYSDPDISGDGYSHQVLPSPAEDGSYGTNGDGVFGFTPEEIYIEHNMKYIVSTVPLSFRNAVQRLTIINIETQEQLTKMMGKLK